MSRQNRTFVGTGDPSGCLSILDQVVDKAEAARCYPKPCGVGVSYQPTIDSGMQFYAVGAFQYAMEAIGAVEDDDVFVPRMGFRKAAEYCAKVTTVIIVLKLHCFNFCGSVVGLQQFAVYNKSATDRSK